MPVYRQTIMFGHLPATFQMPYNWFTEFLVQLMLIRL